MGGETLSQRGGRVSRKTEQEELRVFGSLLNLGPAIETNTGHVSLLRSFCTYLATGYKHGAPNGAQEAWIAWLRAWRDERNGRCRWRHW